MNSLILFRLAYMITNPLFCNKLFDNLMDSQFQSSPLQIPCEVAVSQCSCKFLSLSSLAIAAVLDDRTLLNRPSAGATEAAY